MQLGGPREAYNALISHICIEQSEKYDRLAMMLVETR